MVDPEIFELEKDLKEVIFVISRAAINGFNVDVVHSEYVATGSITINGFTLNMKTVSVRL